jgi:hypothetical protein
MIPGCLLFLLLLATHRVHSCESNAAVFDTERMTASLIFKKDVIYAGEFSCLPPTSNGTRHLIRFAVAIFNPTNCSIRFHNYPSPLRINYWLYDSFAVLKSASYFNVSCVRDVFCPVDPEQALQAFQAREDSHFLNCQVSGISTNCTFYTSHRIACQWVDITGLSPTDTYTLSLQLQPSVDGLGIGLLNESIVNFTFIPSQLPDGITITTGTIVGSILSFVVPIGIFYIGSMIIICRRKRDVRIIYRHTMQ